MMYYQLIQLLILGYSIIYPIESSFIYNLTNTEKLLCYSCKGNSCEKVANEEDNMVVCNKNTQLCWAGFINQQPYRTCASRYCTPSDISIDSDIRIEICCHSNLCNSVTLSWLFWSKWYQKHTTHHLVTSAYPPAISTTTRIITKKTSAKSRMYIFNEVDESKRKSSLSNNNEEGEQAQQSNSKFNASNPATFGINWEPVLSSTGFNNCVALINLRLILLMSFLLVL